MFACVVDAGTPRLLYANAQLRALLGSEPASASLEVPELLRNVPEDEVERLRRVLTASFGGGQTFVRETCKIVRGGTTSWLDISVRRAAEASRTVIYGACVERSPELSPPRPTMRSGVNPLQLDALTGLPNRSWLIERIEQSLSSARRKKDRLAVLFVGLDRFKNINDSMGHSAGDQLLQCVAERLRGNLRGSDLVARIGGDEFGVALAQIESSRDVALVAEKLLTALGKPLTIGDQELAISASIGIGLFPDDAAEAAELIRNADAAMYHAKKSGRSAYRFYTRDLNERALERLSTENALRQALSRSEFVIHYQPQVALATGALIGAEALVRWRRPGRGLVMPGGFIPVAEERGLIAAIDAFVLQETCRQAAAWSGTGLVVPRLSVNVSASEFHQQGFVERVEAALSAHSMKRGAIELELTESIVMHDSEAAIAILRRLHDAGIELSIDDFGTGYSSLNYLRRFPIHRIKVDQSFVREMATDSGAIGIVRGIIALAKSLKLEVIAEGVETIEQLERLRAEGCDGAQGFLFSRGIPSDEFAALLRGWRPSGRPSAPAPNYRRWGGDDRG